MSRTHLVLNSRRYAFATDLRTGQRAFTVKSRPSQPGDPGGLDFREWTPWGPDLNSRKTPAGYLGREYGDGTDGRWDNVDCLGPEMGTLTLTTYDTEYVHAAYLLGTTFVLGGSAGVLGGVLAVAAADGQAEVRAASTTYAIITRGQKPAKVRLSNLTLINDGHTFPAAATDIISTHAAAGGMQNEVSVGLGHNFPYEVLSEAGISAGVDAWLPNNDAEPMEVFGQAPDRVMGMLHPTAKGNILTGAVTMQSPNWQTVGSLSNQHLEFTGYTLDGNLSLVGTEAGPFVLNLDTGEFVPLFPELLSSPSTENARQMGRWFPLGAILPGRDGVRYSNGLQGESWGVERFLGNASPVRGYPTGGGGSMKWYVQAVYDEISTDTWIIAWRPRQAGDPHPHPMSPYVIGHLTAQQARYVRYVGYANGERTTPLWTFGRATNMGYMLDGRTSRFIDDTSYRHITGGNTYLAEEYLDGVLADIEAVEFMTAHCSSTRTVTPMISIDGGASWVSLATQTTNGFHRVLAVSGGAPLSTLQGANRIKPRLSYAMESATGTPKTVSRVRVYFRWRPLEVRDFTWTMELIDQPTGQTANEQEAALEALPRGVPVLVNEDQNSESFYVRITSVAIEERALDSGNVAAGVRGSRRVAEVKGTEWAVA